MAEDWKTAYEELKKQFEEFKKTQSATTARNLQDELDALKELSASEMSIFTQRAVNREKERL